MRRGAHEQQSSALLHGVKQGNRLTRRPCKGDEFEILIFRVRDKMLVFAGVVKKCLQNGHLFRVAGVWLKSENLRFACAVTRLCSSRVKKNTRNLWFSIIRIISGRHSLFQFFPLLDAGGARALVAKQNPQSATRQRCDAMSSCRPMCTFFCVRFCFFCGASTEVAITWCPQFKHFAIWHNHFDNTVIYFLVITYTFSVNIYKSRQNDKFEPTLPPPPTSPLMIIRQHAQRVHLP